MCDTMEASSRGAPGAPPTSILAGEPLEELVGMRSSFAVGARNARVSTAPTPRTTITTTATLTTITARCHSEFVS